MELLAFCNSSPSFRVSSLNRKFTGKTLNSSRSKIFLTRGARVARTTRKSKWKSLGGLEKGHLNRFKIDNLDRRDESRLFASLEGFPNENCNCYVVDGSEDLRTISEREHSSIVIPGLPDESDGNSSSPITSCFWEWKPKFTVHYEKSGAENVKSPPLLFLPGFGVGSFHYEKQLKDLGREFRVWALDFLGQGMSLPSEDPAPSAKEEDVSEEKDLVWGFGEEPAPWANELVYSMDLWQDQVRHFIEEMCW